MDLIEKTGLERELISNELYHLASQTIYSLILGIKMVLPLEMDDKLRKYLIMTEKHSNESLNRLRDLAFQLHPVMLNDLGLLPTLETFFNKINKNNDNPIEFHLQGNINRLSLEKEMFIYRICQEIITHLCEHQAKSIYLNIFHSLETVMVEIISSLQKNIGENEWQQAFALIRKRIEKCEGSFQLLHHHPQLIKITIQIPN